MEDNTTLIDNENRADNTNLSVKIEIEKNGASTECLSSVVSKDTIYVSHAFQEKQENGSINATIFSFSGTDIRKLSTGCYSINYKVGLKVPLLIGKDSIQYQDIGSISSINVNLGQPVYLFENNTYKVKMTIHKK